MKQGRLGLYFFENGANQRPSNVIYDRAHSSVSVLKGSDYAWDKILDGASWLHTTGITPALSQTSAEAAASCGEGCQGKGTHGFRAI